MCSRWSTETKLKLIREKICKRCGISFRGRFNAFYCKPCLKPHHVEWSRKYNKQTRTLAFNKRRYRLFKSNPDEWKKHLNYGRVLRKKRRLEVLAHYGNQCNCCGMSGEPFLCLDHISGNGNEHRKLLRGQHIYHWIIKKDYPDGFQLLCYNCNYAKKHNNNICPHRDTISTQ